MAAKRGGKKRDDEAALPKFGGFKPLAGTLDELKAKLDAEQKAEEARRQSDARQGRAPRPAPRPAPPPRSAEPPRRSDLDDEMSFHRLVSGVTPLEPGGARRVPKTTEVRAEAGRKAAEIKAKAEAEARDALAHLHSIVDDASRFEVSDDGRRVVGRRVDAPPDLVRSLRRGSLPIDARLDLHGLSAAQAEERVVAFLRAMRSQSERCVLVIHGKGERHGGAGVLRGEIAAWLSQGKAREHVTAFATARDEDGGEGAMYVALRR